MIISRTIPSDIGFGGRPKRKAEFVASDWRPYQAGTLQGFLSITTPSGFKLLECTYHRHAGGKRWIGLPGKPQIDQDGRVRVDRTTGKKLYTQVIEICGKEPHGRFQEAALAAVDKLLGGGDR